MTDLDLVEVVQLNASCDDQAHKEFVEKADDADYTEEELQWRSKSLTKTKMASSPPKSSEAL